MYASVHHFLKKERNLLSITEYFIFYDFSWRYLCKTWWYHENFKKLKKMLSEYPSLNHDQKLFIKRHTYVYNWCQDTTCFSISVKPQLVLKGVIDWGGARFHKKFSWSIKMFHFERWSEYGYVSLNEFFMSFSINSKSFKTHCFWHITIPPHELRGSAKIVQNIRKD